MSCNVWNKYDYYFLNKFILNKKNIKNNLYTSLLPLWFIQKQSWDSNIDTIIMKALSFTPHEIVILIQ